MSTTDSNPNSHPEFVTLQDFKIALEAMLETESNYCIVGGLAVGQWAEALLTPAVRSQFEIPIRSKDIDHPFKDSNNLAEILEKKPWAELLPEDQKEMVLQACQTAKRDLELRIHEKNSPPS